MDLGSDPTHSSTTSSSARHRHMVIRHDADSNEDDEDFDDFSDIEPELVQLNNRGSHGRSGLSDTEADFLDSSTGNALSSQSTSSAIADRNKDLDNNSKQLLAGATQHATVGAGATQVAAAPP